MLGPLKEEAAHGRDGIDPAESTDHADL